jgi:crotonobetainyl-CoA:carnitine CoA-transferase CaiB-like acyl-CoA transferase
MFAAIEPKFWRRFCDAAMRSDLKDRVSDEELVDFGEDDDSELLAELVAIIASRTQSEWVELALLHDFPVTPVVELGGLSEDPHAAERHAFVSAPHPETGESTLLIALPIRIEGQSFEVGRVAPKMGEHTDQILAELAL